MNVIRVGIGCLTCTWLLMAAEGSQVVDGARCEAKANGSVPERDARSSDEVKFTVSDRTRFIMRRVIPPEGATDFRLLGESGAPAILSLIRFAARPVCRLHIQWLRR